MTPTRRPRSQLAFDFGALAPEALSPPGDPSAVTPTPSNDALTHTVDTSPRALPELEPAPVWSIALDHWLAVGQTETSSTSAGAPVKRRRTRSRSIDKAA